MKSDIRTSNPKKEKINNNNNNKQINNSPLLTKNK